MKVLPTALSAVLLASKRKASHAFCNWGWDGTAETSVCEGGEQGGEWCNASESNCETGCGGRWCNNPSPPSGDGYCNWGWDGTAETSVCEGGQQGGEWCNMSESNCESGCSGRWCTEDIPTPPSPPTQSPPPPSPGVPPSCSGQQTSSSKSVYQSPFTGVIDSTKTLQHAKTSTCLTQADMKNNKVLDDSDTKFKVSGGKLQFHFYGSTSNRMELRGKSFSHSSRDKRWNGRFTFPTTITSSGFTVGQIFGTGDYSQPILRIAYIASRNGVKDRLWAVYKNHPSGSPPSSYKDLGPVSAGATYNVKMRYRPGGSNKITLYFKNESTDAEISWDNTLASAWRQSGSEVYFKAGCYLQKDGDCKVDFSGLYFDD